MKARPTQSRKGVKGGLRPFSSAPRRVKGQRPLWGLGQRPNSSTVDHSKGEVNKGAGSEASLPVTLRSRRSAPKLLYPPFAHCRAKWARLNCWSCDHSCFSPNAGISPLRRRQGAMETDEVRDRPLDPFVFPYPDLTFIGSRQIFGIRTSKSTHKSAFSGVSPPFIIERRSFDEKAF